MAREHAAISETCEPLKPTEGNPHEVQSTRGKKPLTAQALAERLRAAEQGDHGEGDAERGGHAQAARGGPVRPKTRKKTWRCIY